MIHHLKISEHGYYLLHGEPLLVTYPDGDYDLASPELPRPWACLHGALYDFYQRCDYIKDGDEIWLYGQKCFYAAGVHIVPTDAVKNLIKLGRAD